jgi:hypothetical protein
LTSPQTKKIIDIAKAQGHIWLQQVHAVYQTPKAARNCLEHLVKRGLLQESKDRLGRFDYNGYNQKKTVQVNLLESLH